jgi:Flp pilus assembly protein TadG
LRPAAKEEGAMFQSVNPAPGKLRALLEHFRRDERGASMMIFGLSFLPVLLMLGVGADYARAQRDQSRLQAAVDNAVLTGAMKPASQSVSAANSVLSANLPTTQAATLSNVSFTTTGSQFTGTASTTTTTAFMQLVGYPSLQLTATAAANYAANVSTDACIVTLGLNLASTANSFTLNGAPFWNLAGCNVMSNTSMNCNGHGGGAVSSSAVGAVSSCTNPAPHSSAWADVYSTLQSNISQICTAAGNGVSWTSSSLPSDTDLIDNSAHAGYAEYRAGLANSDSSMSGFSA